MDVPTSGPSAPFRIPLFSSEPYLNTMIPLSLLITTILATTASANTPTSAGAKFKELYGFGTSSPKLNAFPDQHLSRRLEGGKPTLTSNITTIKGVSTTAAVHWNDVEFTSAYDWIGMWPLTDTYPLFSAPIKFKFVCEECKKAASDPTNPNPPYPAPNGTLIFNIINRRIPVVFIYVHGSAQYPESLARSQNITVENPQIPQGGHLSLVRSDPSKMRLQWSSSATSDPHVKWGLKPKSYTKRSECCKETTKVPYTIEDMCDRDVQPAGLHGWFPPPSNYTALFEGLTPNTEYYYVYGSDQGGWSDEKSFTSAPIAKSSQRTVMAAFGDMGNTESDGSYHHSWDFGDKGEVPSSNTTTLIEADKEIDMVLHIGDISYACGFLSEWDNFFSMIEPVATRLPWMTGIGNHEQGWSKGAIPGTDSGGECGVPYNANFPFASQNPSSSYADREPWYDFSYGNVHTVVFSTEHDFTVGSPQYKWLERTLAAVDRTITPWLMVAGHRPMYVDTAWPGTDIALRANVEALFHKYKVDVAIWGHNHSYQRTCSVNNLTCVEEHNKNCAADDIDCLKHGVQHFVIGMAGYELNPIPDPKADYMMVTNNDTWGYLKMDFKDEYELTTTFYSDADGSVKDTFTLKKTKAEVAQYRNATDGRSTTVAVPATTSSTTSSTKSIKSIKSIESTTAPLANPQQWTAHNATYSNYGTMPDCEGGQTLSYYYDYENLRAKQLWYSGDHAGYTDVFRYDEKVPGEMWSRGYHWKPGQEAVCCYFNLCRAPSCSAMTAERMMKLEVTSGAKDLGSVGPHSEHYYKDMSIKALNVGNINDWIVDTQTMAITNWTSNASLPRAGWCKAQRLYEDLEIGNLTEADFAYPRMCTTNMCESSVSEYILRNMDM